MSKTVSIIGAGIGGLATALRLAKLGFNVTIYEKNEQAGGRLNILKKDGFTFDVGPSFFSMSYVFKEFAEECNINLPFEYYELEPLYTVYFPGGRQYKIYKDIKRLAEQFSAVEPNFETSMKNYLASAKALFDTSIKEVVGKNHESILDYLLSLMKNPFWQLPKLFRNFYQEVSKYFRAEEVRQIISLVAFFLGSTPFDTSAAYTILSYVEFQHDGYHNVKGGMYKIVEGFINELNKMGVKIIYNTEVVGAIKNKDLIEGLITNSGEIIKSDYYVINADAALFRARILKRKDFSEEKLRKMKWTFAPLTIYLGISGKIESLDHHNYFLGKNYRGYAEKIFKGEVPPEKPYYYVNVLSRNNPECAPPGCETLFIVCPMPDLRFKPNWDDRDKIVDDIINDLSSRIGVNISERIISKTVYTPIEWAKKFNLYMGSGLGLAHNLKQMGYFRPKNKDEIYKNLFYVGASTTPGTGLPMCIISSKLVVERILKNKL
ncbi:MAG: phytoene desaturase family protein [Candidatus Kryptonium sp.]